MPTPRRYGTALETPKPKELDTKFESPMKLLKVQFAAARMNREAETQKKNLNPRTFLLDDMILEWLGLRLEPLRRLLETATRPMLVHMPLTESRPAILTPFQPSAFLPPLLRTVTYY